MAIEQDLLAKKFRESSASDQIIEKLLSQDRSTFIHAIGVTGYFKQVAQWHGLRLTSADVFGALLHDVGKSREPFLGLSRLERIFTCEEETLMNGHPEAGYIELSDAGLADVVNLDIVRSHHVRFDEKNTPINNLFAVCDAYDALREKRPYRLGYPKIIALEMLRSEAGGKFDPEIVEAFCGYADHLENGLARFANDLRRISD